MAADRQLASITKAQAVTFEHDANRTPATPFPTQTSKLTYMTDSSNQLYFNYDANGLFSVIYNGATYYYVQNAQGDVIAITNASGTRVVEYTYDAWGNILSTTGSMRLTLGTTQPFRYRGYVYDAEMGLYYLQSRYYDPALGRFICADAILTTGQGLTSYNMFAYCLNNPINLLDDSGCKPKSPYEYDYGNGVVGCTDTGTGTPIYYTNGGTKETTTPNNASKNFAKDDRVTVTVTYYSPNDVSELYIRENSYESIIGKGIYDIVSCVNEISCPWIEIPMDIYYAVIDEYHYRNHCAMVSNARKEGLGIVYVEERWEIWDGEPWSVTISYYDYWQGDYGSYPYALLP